MAEEASLRPHRLAHRDRHTVTIRASRSRLSTDPAQTAFFTGDYLLSGINWRNRDCGKDTQVTT